MTATPACRAARLRAFPTIAVLCSALVAACSAPRAKSRPVPASTQPSRPNILFLLGDDVRPDAIGALGGVGASTEHLDALVARGTAFTTTVHMGSPHGAICIASRAMIFTGRNLWTHGDNALPDQPLWPEAFATAGYATFGCGKWHNGEASFSRSFEFEGAHAGGFLRSTDEKGDAYDRPPADGAPDTWRADDRARGGHWLVDGGQAVHSSERWADEAIAFLERHRASGDGRPFFASVAFHAPHDPRQAPTDYLAKRPLDSIGLAPNAMPSHPFDQGDARVRDERLAPFPRSPLALRTHEREYRAIFEHLDDQIGRILTTLDTLRLSESTIVVFVGDHGLSVGRHGLLGKQSLYEHSVRTPFVVAGPGVARDRRVDAPVYLHSVLATAADLAGVAPMASLEPQAASIAKLARDGTPVASAPFTTVYSAYGRNLQRMVRDDRWKLIVYPQARVTQLFDLANDPWELENLAGRPVHAATLARLHGELLAWMQRTEDPLSADAVADACTWPAPAFARPTTDAVESPN